MNERKDCVEEKDAKIMDWVLLFIGLIFSSIFLIMTFKSGSSILFDVGSGASRLRGIPGFLIFIAFILMIVFTSKRIINRYKKKHK